MRKILFVAGTHGNEGFAVDVMRDIEKEYDPEAYSYDWITGNPKALQQNTRFFEQDLNRSAPGAVKSTIYEERRAAEIVALSENYDNLIDLHGTSADCGVVTIIPYPTQETLQLAQAVPVKRNVVWHSESSRLRGPLAQHVKCPAIEIECGPKENKQVSEELYIVVTGILRANADGTLLSATPDPSKEFYSVYGREEGELDTTLHDFVEASNEKETFYPFLSSNQYGNTKCYKMKRVSLSEIGLKG